MTINKSIDIIVVQKIAANFAKHGLLNKSCSNCNWQNTKYEFKCDLCDGSSLYELDTEIIAKIVNKLEIDVKDQA